MSLPSSHWPLRNSPFLNMAPETPRFDDEYNDYESIDHWACPYCFKTISSSRPPIFNPDNCSCGEAGAFIGGEHEPPALQQQVAQHNTELYCQRPSSYASSSYSISCPEGPEREDPNINVGNTYVESEFMWQYFTSMSADTRSIRMSEAIGH